ncbi:Mur ligase family protein [SAR86 cluster bacterium]|nr:Mur ligase family protein [SAR86 cluster bacterium]
MTGKEDFVLVLGAGLTGQSIGRYLENKENFFFFDTRKLGDLPKNFLANKSYSSKLIEEKNIRYKNISEIICSPGFNKKHLILKKAKENKIPISSDIEIFTKKDNSIKIIITGTNGKTTVSKMIEHVLNENGFLAKAIGNIGNPALDYLNRGLDYSILEVSSFQIEISSDLESDIAVVLNISVDHLDKHDSFNEYAGLKNSIFKKAKKTIGSKSDKFISDKLDIYFEDEEIEIDDKNFNAVKTVIDSLKLTIDLKKSLKNFKKPAHRFEIFFKDSLGNIFINDSKATNIGACMEAVKTASKFGEINILCGGDGKGTDFSEFSSFLNNNCKNIILFGKDKDLIKKNIAKEKCFLVNDFKDAVLKASELISSNEVLLLSPGCASFDAFLNYEERGDFFKKIILGEKNH